MDELIAVVFTLGTIAAVLFALPIVALIKASRAAGNVGRLEKRIAELERRAAAPERGVPVVFKPAEEKPGAAIPPAESEPTVAEQPPTPPVPAPILSSQPPPVPAAARPTPSDDQESDEAAPPQRDEPDPQFKKPAWVESFDWEQFMGAKLFAWLGGLALFLGVVFFVKYSFEQNLIPPSLRVALGFAAGIGLLVGGFAMDRRKYTVTSHTLCATGVLVLYATTFACRSIYHFPFFGVVPTFLLMALVTAVAFLLAVRLDAMVVAVLGLVGGFLTPALVSTGHDQALGLFSYVALLDIGLLATVFAKRWNFLLGLAAFGTIATQLAWFANFFNVQKAGVGLAVFVGFSVLMLAAAVVAKRRGRLNGWFLGAAAAMAASGFVFSLALLGFPELIREPVVFLASVFGSGLCLFGLSLLEPSRPHFQALGGVAGFLLLSGWVASLTSWDGPALPWVLGACFLFALLHSAFPLVLQRLNPERVPPRWLYLLPLLAFLPLFSPVSGVDHLPIMTWTVVLGLGVLAALMAVLARAPWMIAGALLLTLALLGTWIGQVPPEPGSLGGLLVVIGGFALAGFVVTYVLRGRLTAAAESQDAELADWEKPLAVLTPHLPAASVALPFALLALVTDRLPLANPSPVFGLALLLALLLLGLAAVLPNRTLPLVGLVCVFLLQVVWQSARLPDALAAGINTGPLVWHVIFFLVFAAFPFIFMRRFSNSLLPWIASALSGPLHFLLVHNLVKAAWPNEFMGLVPAIFAIPSIAALLVLTKSLPFAAEKRPALLAWFGGVALFFITLIFPIQFSREWITLGWALEGAALLWLFHRVPHPGLRLTGIALLAIVFARLALNPAVLGYHERGALPILNWYLYTYGVAAVCLFLGAWLLRPPRDRVFDVNVPPLLCALGAALVFLLLNIEIADFFTAEGHRVLTFEFSGNFARDMTYTIAWSLFALLLLMVGLWRRIPMARYAGLALMGVALLKLFLHDLATLTALYRIAAFIATAVIAIVASFLYQKLLASPQDVENPESDDEIEPSNQ